MTGRDCLSLEANRGDSARTIFTKPDSTEQSKKSAQRQQCSRGKLLHRHGTLQARSIKAGRSTSKEHPTRKLCKRAILQAKNIPIGGSTRGDLNEHGASQPSISFPLLHRSTSPSLLFECLLISSLLPSVTISFLCFFFPTKDIQAA